MKKTIYFLVVPLLVAGGWVFANRVIKNETKPSAQPVAMAEKKAPLNEKELWEASPAGLQYKAWEVSAAGVKVHASHDKIKKYIRDSANMEALVTSVSFQRANVTSGPKWILVKIDGEDYMMQFVPAEFKQLSSLKVNDKIIIRSRSAGYSPNHPYLILSGDYIEHNNKVLFKRDFSKNKRC